MTAWSVFPWFFGASVVCWALGGIFILRKQKSVWVYSLTFLGWLALAAFVVLLWVNLQRPPLRTLGETRLWYAVWVPLCSLFIAWRWRMQWPIIYGTALSVLFLGITLAYPESHDKTLMPALQSPWFIPHVIVYMLAYAFLTAAALSGMQGLWLSFRKQTALHIVEIADSVVWIGLALLTMGLLFGALWAKEAWGHYWTWDPKETWAFLTWSAYLFYIHIRIQHPQKYNLAFLLLNIAWVVLLLCWLGVNVMPSASQSAHIYT